MSNWKSHIATGCHPKKPTTIRGLWLKEVYILGANKFLEKRNLGVCLHLVHDIVENGSGRLEHVVDHVLGVLFDGILIIGSSFVLGGLLPLGGRLLLGQCTHLNVNLTVWCVGVYVLKGIFNFPPLDHSLGLWNWNRGSGSSIWCTSFILVVIYIVWHIYISILDPIHLLKTRSDPSPRNSIHLFVVRP